MYRENEFGTRRDGADEGYIRRMLDGGCAQGDDGENSTNVTPRRSWGLVGGYPLAMVYSPYQNWQNLYTPDVALEKGTLFGELDLPIESTNYRRGC